MVKLGKQEVQGIDVSHHQGTINWAKVAGSGIKWASIKATEALHFVDPMYHRNVREAVDSGITVVPYHFAHHVNDPIEEARHFAHVIEEHETVVLDWEWRLGDIEHYEQAKWIKSFAQYYGGNVILYCSRYPASYLDPHLDMDFWIAAPKNTGWPKLTNNGVIGWQYNWHGNIPGIVGPVDLDVVRI